MSFKRIWGVLVALLLLTVALFTMGCENQNPPDPPVTDDGKATYTISVVDYKGNVPAVDVLIEVQKDGATVGMKKADANGCVSFELDKGDYTFIPTAAKGEFYYDAEACVLSAEKTQVSVTLYGVAGNKQTIYPHFESIGDRMAYDAATVGEGATYVSIDRDDMAYYIFAPTRGGIYRISYVAEAELTLGYFGDANVVLTESAAKVQDGAFEIEVKNGSVGTEGAGGTLRMVLGLGSATVDEAILIIERVGDPTPVLEWVDYFPTKLPTDSVRSDYLNHELVDISITDPLVKVTYNPADGLYHYGAVDGPIVFVRISSPSKYLASFTEICDTTRMYKLFYEGEKLVKKESYNEMIAAYAAICDGNGVVPLTDELIYMIKNCAEQMGWFEIDVTGSGVLTADQNGNPTGVTAANLVKENAYLFACCYVNEFANGGDIAISLTVPLSEEKTANVAIKAGESVKFRATDRLELIIEDADGLSVTYNGETYLARDGVIVVPMIEDKPSFVINSDRTREFVIRYFLYAEE